MTASPRTRLTDTVICQQGTLTLTGPYMHVEVDVRQSSTKTDTEKFWPLQTDLLAHLSLAVEDKSYPGEDCTFHTVAILA